MLRLELVPVSSVGRDVQAAQHRPDPVQPHHLRVRDPRQQQRPRSVRVERRRSWRTVSSR